MKHLISFSVITLMAVPAHAQERFVSLVAPYLGTVVTRAGYNRISSGTNTLELLPGETAQLIAVSQAAIHDLPAGPGEWQNLILPDVAVFLKQDGSHFLVFPNEDTRAVFSDFTRQNNALNLGPFLYGRSVATQITVTGPGTLLCMGAGTLFSFRLMPTLMEAQQDSVVMESSDDLLQWVTTTNGLKSGEIDHFFRVRLQKSTPYP